MSKLTSATTCIRIKQPQQLNSESENDEIIFEEKQKDVIYQVTYKKVYVNDTVDHSQNNCNNINDSCLVYTRVKTKQIKFGTLDKLIDHFTNTNGELDSNVVNVFLATYRTFTDCKCFIELLLKKYDLILPASLEITEDLRVNYVKSFRSLILTWLDSYLDDFNEAPLFNNLKILLKFCQKYSSDLQDLLAFVKCNLETLSNHTSIQRKTNSINHLFTSKCDLNIKIASHHNHVHSHQRSSSNGSIIVHNNNVNDSIKNDNNNFFIINKNSDVASRVTLNTKFKDVDECYVAEQLTFIDKELFKKVKSYNCLGSIWSTRKKQSMTSSLDNNNNNNNFKSISDFIEQFNVVTFLVQGTILDNVNLSSSKRAKIIEKWIRIAQFCRNYKNFSSLNAIVQGLDTPVISRLERTWNDVSEESSLQFKELIELFSQENNQQLFRETLMKELDKQEKRLTSKHLDNITLLEGTAKFAYINGGINATLSRKAKEKLMKQRKSLNEPMGTVPFLGTFLKDLEYIHAQNSTKTDDGLINFAKKRKEFEIIAQIKLFQRAAQFYTIDEDPLFKQWLKSLPSFNEEKKAKIDRELSSSGNTTPNKKKSNSISRSSRCESLDSLNSTNNLILLKQQHSRQSSNSSTEQTVSTNHMNNSIGSGASFNEQQQQHSPATNLKTSTILAKVNIQDYKQLDGCISPSVVSYKKISIKDSDRTKDVKRNILNKFLIDSDKFDKYNLIQVFNDSHDELLINDQFNVYYAVKNVDDIQFVLRPKSHTHASSSSSLLTPSSYSPPSLSYQNSSIPTPPLNQHKKYSNGSPKLFKNSNALLPPQIPDYNNKKSWNLLRK